MRSCNTDFLTDSLKPDAALPIFQSYGITRNGTLLVGTPVGVVTVTKPVVAPEGTWPPWSVCCLPGVDWLAGDGFIGVALQLDHKFLVATIVFWSNDHMRPAVVGVAFKLNLQAEIGVKAVTETTIPTKQLQPVCAH
jgi:hypothetical protein